MKRVKIQLTEQGIKGLDSIFNAIHNHACWTSKIGEIAALELHGEITQAHLIRHAILESLETPEYKVEDPSGEYVKTTTILIPEYIIDHVQGMYEQARFELSTTEMINRCIDHGIQKYVSEYIL